jgi:hypothetical protein
VIEELKARKGSILSFFEEHPAPYVDKTGNLIIPRNCAPCYRWWDGGLPLKAILKHLNAPRDVLERYVQAGDVG